MSLLEFDVMRREFGHFHKQKFFYRMHGVDIEVCLMEKKSDIDALSLSNVP